MAVLASDLGGEDRPSCGRVHAHDRALLLEVSMIPLSLLLGSLLVAPFSFQAADGSPVARPVPTTLDEWGALPADEQQASIRSLLGALAPSMEMDVCYRGELILHAKNLEVCRAILDETLSAPSEA